MATIGKTLVEASPRDTIWGVGLGINNPNIQNPKFWRGQNLLGICLGRAREMIQIQDAEEAESD